MVQTFYNEMAKDGVSVTEPTVGDDSASPIAPGQQVANISATIDRGAAQQTLINELNRPAWRYEQFSTPSTGADTLPSIGVTGIRLK